MHDVLFLFMSIFIVKKKLNEYRKVWEIKKAVIDYYHINNLYQ